MGDRSVPDRCHGERGRLAEPLFRGRPARPVLAAGSHLQPAAPVLRRAAEWHRTTDRGPGTNPVSDAVAVWKRQRVGGREPIGQCLALGEPKRLGLSKREPIGVTVGQPKRLAHAEPNSNPDANTHTNSDPDAYSNTHADPDAYPYAYSNTHADPDAYPHAYSNTDAWSVRHRIRE